MAHLDQKTLIADLAYIPNALLQRTGTVHIPHSSQPGSGAPECEPINIRPSRDANWSGSPEGAPLGRPEIFCDNEDALVDLLRWADDLPTLYGSVEEVGLDALSWYISYHQHREWGIYIPLTGLVRFASLFAESTPNPLAAVNVAFDLLLSHESVHYGVDVAVSQLELIEHRALYIANRNLLRNGRGYIEAEEKIANAAMLILAKRLSS